MIVILLSERVYSDQERERLVTNIDHAINAELIASVSSAHFTRRQESIVEGSYVKLTTGEMIRVNESPIRVLEMLEEAHRDAQGEAT